MIQFRGWLCRQWAKQEVKIAVGVSVASLIGAALGIRIGVQHGYLDLGVGSVPSFTTQEAPWTTTTALTVPRRSGQVSGATATSIITKPGGTGTTIRDHRSRASSTTMSTSTGGVTSTRDTPTTTTLQPPTTTLLVRPTATTPTPTEVPNDPATSHP